MLTITPQAEEAIRGILASQDAPDGSMFRISPQGQDGASPGPALVVSITDSPPPEDRIIEGDQVEICVEPNAASMLEDKELDATVDGGQVSFSIGEQND